MLLAGIVGLTVAAVLLDWGLPYAATGSTDRWLATLSEGMTHEEVRAILKAPTEIIQRTGAVDSEGNPCGDVWVYKRGRARICLEWNADGTFTGRHRVDDWGWY